MLTQTPRAFQRRARPGGLLLAVPILGTLSPQRSAGIVGRLLDVLVERRARPVILDLTGADVREASGLDHLTKMVQSIRLLGARSIWRPDLSMVATFQPQRTTRRSERSRTARSDGFSCPGKA